MDIGILPGFGFGLACYRNYCQISFISFTMGHQGMYVRLFKKMLFHSGKNVSSRLEDKRGA